MKTKWLLASWLGVGILTEILGLTGHLGSWLSCLLLFPAGILLWQSWAVLRSWRSLVFGEKILLIVLALIWLTHLTGVFVPETGFDALWYHLPVAAAFAQHGGFIYVPTLYQSLNPYFADGIFLLGYLGAGSFGTKIVAYLFGLTLVVVSYAVARHVLPRRWALVAAILISTFQVVAWQSSSFYIDVAKAVWEVGAIWALLQWRAKRSHGKFSSFSSEDPRIYVLLMLLCLGASLASKLFSLALLPVFIVILSSLAQPGGRRIWAGSRRDSSLALGMTVVAFLLPLPFYLFAFHATGNPFYALGLHVDKLGEIGGNASLPGYLWQRTLLLPSSLTELTLFCRDYTTLLFLVCAPIVWIYRRQIWQSWPLRALLLFSVGEWLIWWYVPPLSTRYGLAGFIALAIIFLWAIRKYIQDKPGAKVPLLATIVIAIIINLLPRSVPLKRNLLYLSGQQTQQQYLNQFKDGWIDSKLTSWYKL